MVDNDYLKTQSELVKLLVHDLRNPISALSANISYVESVLPEDEDLKEAVADSQAAIELLLHMSRNIEMIGKLEAGEPFETQDVALDGFVRSAVRRNQALAKSSGMSVRFEEPIPQVVCRVSGQLLQLLVDNLIMSAMRHSSGGAEVTLVAQVADDRLRLTVRDPGFPLPADLNAQLLTRSGQLVARHRPDARYARAWGLYAVGLAADTLGGEVAIESGPGRTEFSLIIPV